jgi:hypothetical protein
MLICKVPTKIPSIIFLPTFKTGQMTPPEVYALELRRVSHPCSCRKILRESGNSFNSNGMDGKLPVSWLGAVSLRTMRYVTKMAKERNRRQDQELAARRHWMTLVEAIKEIKNKGSCEDQEALEDLFSAIVDRKVRGLLGDISYEENSLSGYQQLMPHDLQREVKVYLSGPGYINFAEQYPPTTKRRNTDRFDYAKVLLVTGRIGKITFNESDLYKSPVFPDVDELQFGPVLISRDDMRNWPFALEEAPPEVRSTSSQITGSSVPDATSMDVQTATSRRRGRPRGSGTFEVSDAPLLAKMRELIDTGVAKSANDAARQVAGDAGGNGTIESKITRLAKGYRAQNRSDQK